MLCSDMGNKAHGQTLVFPEGWMKPWYETSPLYKEDTLTIRIMGDIMMHTRQIENTSRNNGHSFDFSSFFQFIEDDIREADLSIGNMEFTLAGKPYSGYPSFSAPDGFETYLAECGFDIFLASNNHIYDKGKAGVERTLSRYRDLEGKYGIIFTGLAGDSSEMQEQMPLTLLRKGIRIALVNFTYGTNMSIGSRWPATVRSGDRESIASAIAKAEENGADLILALPHWGTEYQLKHSRSQEDLAKWLVEAGVDMIIGSHPHVIQDYQEINGTPVAYSLGNAVSNMSATNTQLELMATIRIIRKNNGDISILPIDFTYLWCSRPGGYNDSYTVIPVADFIGTRSNWQGSWEYDKMVATYNRVLKTSGIPDAGAKTE